MLLASRKHGDLLGMTSNFRALVRGIVLDRMREHSLLNPGYQLPNLAGYSRWPWRHV